MRVQSLRIYFFCLLFVKSFLLQGINTPDSLFSKAVTYKETGVYDLALENYFKALEGFKARNKNNQVINTYQAIGLVYREINKNTEAKKYFHLALKNSKSIEDRLNISYALNNLGMIAQNELRLDSANFYYQKSLSIKKELNDSSGISRTLTNLGTVEIDENNYRKALSYFYQSLNYKIALKDSVGIINLYSNIGNAYGYLGELDSVSYYLHKGVVFAENQNLSTLLISYYHNLSQLYGELKDFSKVRHYNNLLFNLKDSLFNKTMAKELVKQQMIYQVNLKDKEIAILNKEKELSLKRSQIMWIVIFTLTTIAFLFYLLLRFRAKTIQQNELTYQKQKQIDDLLIQKEKEEKKEIQSEKKQVERELVFSTLDNIKNKESLKDILNGLEENKFSTIKIKLKNLISNNNDWEEFKIQFTKVNPIFFKNLDQKYPHLTETNHRHLAYIKIGMNTKEIARLLNVIPSSIQKSRVRLKKKLRLTKEEDLYLFVKTI